VVIIGGDVTILRHEEKSEEKEKPFMSSLNICPEDCYRKGLGRAE
jgi:hypothetical protein